MWDAYRRNSGNRHERTAVGTSCGRLKNGQVLVLGATAEPGGVATFFVRKCPTQPPAGDSY